MPRRKATTIHHHPRRSRGPPSSSSITPWETIDDIPLEDDDRFQLNRDKILLEADERDDADDDVEEEVFPLKHTLDDGSSATSDDETGSFDVQTAPIQTNRRKDGKVKQQSKTESPPQSGESSEGEEEEGWGSKKSTYYSSNAPELDSEDEESSRLFLQESLRLQEKNRKRLSEDDFGLGDYSLLGKVWKTEPVPKQPVKEFIPTDPLACIRTMERNNPELIALARDWENVVLDLVHVEESMKRFESSGENVSRLGLWHLYHQTLLCYAATVAFYLSLSTSSKYANNTDKLRTHKILERLVTLREASLELEALNDSDESDAAGDSELDFGDGLDLSSMDIDELKSLLEDASLPASVSTQSRVKLRVMERPVASPQRPNFSEKSYIDLEEPRFRSGNKTIRKESGANLNTTHFGEQTRLEEADAQEKKEKKRSLRFHTTRIDSSQVRRRESRLQRGGDDDIPYPTRKGEVNKVSRPTGSSDHAAEDDLNGKKRPISDLIGVPEEGEDEISGYYNLIKIQKQKNKEEKKAAYEEQRAAARYVDADEESKGPRSLTRAILANKGLTSKRSKTVRNPRVKKRIRFDKAQKKVASQKAAYKGGPASGKYGGEQSGINMRTVKSVKL